MSNTRADQSRINGSQSLGPTSHEGKLRSSLNALKHGRRASNAVLLRNESREAFDAWVQSYCQALLPLSSLETRYVREIAEIDWRLSRNRAIATNLLDFQMDLHSRALLSAGITIPEIDRGTKALEAALKASHTADFLTRQESALIRARDSLIRLLVTLRKHFKPADSSSQLADDEELISESPETNESGNEPGQDPEPLP